MLELSFDSPDVTGENQSEQTMHISQGHHTQIADEFWPALSLSICVACDATQTLMYTCFRLRDNYCIDLVLLLILLGDCLNRYDLRHVPIPTR